MMMKNKILFTFLVILLAGINLQAQDPNYSHYWTDRLYLNPAFAGSDKGLNISLINREQWPNITSRFRTYSFSADIVAPNLRGGLGFQAMRNVEGEGRQLTISSNLIYSIRTPLVKERSDLAVGIGIGVIQRKVDYSQLVFSDQIDPVNGVVYSTSAPLENYNSHLKSNYCVGVLFRTYFSKVKKKRMNIGASVYNITQPNLSLLSSSSGESPLPRKINAFLDITIPLFSNASSERFLVQPAFYYTQQGKNFSRDFSSAFIGFRNYILQLNTGVFLRKDHIKNFKNFDALIFLLGYHFMPRTTLYELSYSYDLTVSHLAFNTGGSHEFTLAMYFKGTTIFGKKLNRSGRIMNKCPSFSKGFQPESM